MVQKFGDFRDNLPVGQEYLTLVFSPSSIPIKQRWCTNGLSADFMADYFATLVAYSFAGNEDTKTESDLQAEIKNAVSFIGNELLENAMKFSDDASQHPISLTLQMHSDKLVFLATNSVDADATAKFQKFIQTLITCDPDELYFCYIEQNTQDEGKGDSGLGLLTMINDYQAKLGWKFETVQNNSEAITVTTMVQLLV